jgi:hypothetical protein
MPMILRPQSDDPSNGFLLSLMRDQFAALAHAGLSS